MCFNYKPQCNHVYILSFLLYKQTIGQLNLCRCWIDYFYDNGKFLIFLSLMEEVPASAWGIRQGDPGVAKPNPWVCGHTVMTEMMVQMCNIYNVEIQ